MSLSDFSVETASIVRGGSSFKVRGLSASDLQVLITNTRNSIELVFNLAEANGIHSVEDLNEDKLKTLVHVMIQEFPNIVAMTIALAADDFDNWEKVATFPLSVQVEALERIGRLTFDDASNFGVFQGNVLAVMRTIKNLVTPPTPSQMKDLGHVGTEG